jgi:hypothetical protein
VWNHFYNWHRPHYGINLAVPVSRLSMSRKNLLTLHTPGARPLRLAAGRLGLDLAERGAAVDAAGRHRLAPAGTHLAAEHGGIGRRSALTGELPL